MNSTVVVLILIAAMLAMFLSSGVKRIEARRYECESRGGVMVKGYPGGWECILATKVKLQ